MTIDEAKKEIEDKFQEAAEKAQEFNKALHEFRSIKCDFDSENQDELQQAMKLGHDLDSRTSYLLRMLLIQHGNVLFL